MKEILRERALNIILIVSLTFNILMLVELVKANEVQPTTEENTTVEETQTYNIHQPMPEPIEPPTEETIYVPATPTGNVSLNTVGIASMVEKLADTDFEVGICAWTDIVLDKSEMDLLRTTVYCEAGNQDLETQVMVALTILNRLNAGYADSIREVIYQDRAYTVTKWSNFENRGWTEQVAKAVDIALNENNHPLDMYYFRTDYYHRFADHYMKSDDLYFGTERGD